MTVKMDRVISARRARAAWLLIAGNILVFSLYVAATATMLPEPASTARNNWPAVIAFAACLALLYGWRRSVQLGTAIQIGFPLVATSILLWHAPDKLRSYVANLPLAIAVAAGFAMLGLALILGSGKRLNATDVCD
jgi:hypothetical protein